MRHKIARVWIAQVVEACLEGGFRQARKYVSPELVLKATRQTKPDRRNRGQTLLLTIGRPNYYERRFVKLCLKAGEPLPVRKIQLKTYPSGK